MSEELSQQAARAGVASEVPSAPHVAAPAPPVRHVWIASPDASRTAARPRVFGLTGEERLRRALAGRVPHVTAGARAPSLAPGEPLLVLRDDTVYDERLLPALLAQRDLALRDGREGPLVALVLDGARAAEAPRCFRGAAATAPPDLKPAVPAELVGGYTAQLRKCQPVRVWRIAPERVAALEQALFRASYKGVTDAVTRWLWPVPALAVTRALARAGVAPNGVTALSWLLVVLATLAFAVGAHGPGLAAAWLMTFLDTVDGKLARVTLRASRVGHVLDHGLDLLHPPIWYLAFGASLLADGPAWLPSALQVCVGGYVLGRLLEGAFLLAFGFEIHSWRPVDSAFRLVTARRNPNLVLLTAGVVGGRPDLGLAAVAAWTLASLGFHAVRLPQAFAARRRGHPPTPWQDAAPAEVPA